MCTYVELIKQSTGMDLKKWEHVVLEWVNCLQLSEPVRSLNDLRNGAFFASLAKIMTLDETLSSETCLAAITPFLKTQYPSVGFQNYLNLEKLLESDLLMIASFLLHYTCIYEGRGILISPLCYQLSKTTQICIITFLESITSKTTKEEFFEALEQIVSKCTQPKTLHALTIPSSGLRSSLQDLLQTPPSNLEKDREISKLQSEINLERWEKIDLTKKLHLEKERNKKLSKQVGDKTSEIVRLEGEILELQNKSLPHCEDDESRELQCQLRGEITRLECYIRQLKSEQEQLHTERDTMKEKLRKTEELYVIWQDKALSTEEDFDGSLEKFQQQETELQTLRVHCRELNTFLQEMRATNRCNESGPEVDISISEDRNLETPCEDIAGAVVEVQLRDAQKENAELKNVLKESQESAKKLNEEMSSVKTHLEKLQSDYEILKADNEDLLKKALLLTETEAVLLQTRQELEESLNSEIAALQLQLSKTKATLAEVENANGSLTNALKLLRDDYTNLQESVNNKSSSCDALELEIGTVQAQYNELLEKYNKTNFTMQALAQNLEQIENAMEENLLKLERFAFGSSGSINVKDSGAFVEIFLQLEKNIEQQSKDKFHIEELVKRLKLAATHKKNMEPKIKRIRWTEEQMRVVTEHFSDHIKNKIAPKKKEVEELVRKNEQLFKNKNWVIIKAYVYNCYRDSCIAATHKKNMEPKIKRIRWTEEQMRVVTEHFSDHIKNKIAPKKKEVEELIWKHKKLFKNKNWVTIKAYVYNCYK